MARLGAGALLALLLAVVAAEAAVLPSATPTKIGDLGIPLGHKCEGTVGECDVTEQEALGLSGGGWTGGDNIRRTLAARKPTTRYISYAALRADQVPCNKRGRSYYSNCESQQAANPYRRGCSAITRCARNMN